MRKLVIALPIVLLFLTTASFADHLPENLIARGKPETVLCGIDVIHTTFGDLKKRLGTPQSYTKTEEGAEAIWTRKGSLIHVFIFADNGAYAVDVKGKRSTLAQTGRGLALGQSLTDIKRVYGSKFYRDGNNITIQWEDGTELRAHLASGRISSLNLSAPVE